MKSIIKRGILLVLAACLAAGPAFADEAKKPVVVNDRFDEQSMVTVDGRTIDLVNSEQMIGDEYMGFSFIWPDEWTEVENDGMIEVMIEDDFVMVDYIPERFKELTEQMRIETDGEKWNEMYLEITQNSVRVLCVYRVDSSDAQYELFEEEIKKTYGTFDTLAENGSESISLATNTGLSDETLSATDRAYLEKLLAGCSGIKNSLMLFPRAEYGSEVSLEGGQTLNADLSSFNALDVDGNKVTQDIFSGYDMTVINIWGTFCGPCLDEMDDLGKLKTLLPENVNLIGICIDAAGNLQLAKDIMANAKAEFTTLINSEELNQKLLNEIMGVPTTLFVDKNGTLIGEILEGAPSADDVAQAYLDEISSRLKLVA